MAVLVFANGDIDELGWIGPYLAGATAVIAADGGTNHVLALGRVPDVVVGDMDSLTPAVWQQLVEAGVPLITYPAAKDETDLELALLYAVRTYANEPILVLGAFGGRFDQTLANVLLLAHPQLAGRRIELVEPYERAWLVQQQTTIEGEVGDTVSLIPLGGAVLVQQTTGLAWPLRQEILAFGPARGVSNVLTAVTATITIESGYLLCIHTQKRWQR